MAIAAAAGEVTMVTALWLLSFKPQINEKIHLAHHKNECVRLYAKTKVNPNATQNGTCWIFGLMAVAIFDIAYYTFWFGGEWELNHELIPDRLAGKENAASLFQKEHTPSTVKTTDLAKWKKGCQFYAAKQATINPSMQLCYAKIGEKHTKESPEAYLLS